jgi:hypothetical protein
MQYVLKEMMAAMARWMLSSGAQRTGREADYSPASNAEFKIKGNVFSFPLKPSWRGQRKTDPFVGPVQNISGPNAKINVGCVMYEWPVPVTARCKA